MSNIVERNVWWFANEQLDIDISENDVLDWIKDNDAEYYPTAKELIEESYEEDLMSLYNWYFPKSNWDWEQNRFMFKKVKC